MAFPTVYLSYLNQAITHIDNKLGLYSFLSLAILLLIYLIKPRPQEKVIPSLMFLIKEFQKQKSFSFFRTILRDILFLLQLLMLIIIATAATHPFIETNKRVDTAYSVLIVDISASSNVREGLTTRFSRIIDEAKSQMSGKVSIIAAQNAPYVLLEHGDRATANDILSTLQPTQGLSSLGSSMLIAEELLESKEGKVVVISDFINTDSIDPEVARKTLEAKGHIVEFIDVKKEAENIGFVDREFLDQETKLTVQNFNNKTIETEIKVNDRKIPLTLGPLNREQVYIKPAPGINKIELLHNDDFETDNMVYISMPEKKATKILIVTNNEKSFLVPAIETYAEVWNVDATIELATPPIMPLINHDIVILNQIDESKIPKAVINKIISSVQEDGATLIINAQKDLKQSSFRKILPIELGEYINEEKNVYSERTLNQVTSGISFTKTAAYFTGKAKPDTTVIATTEDKVPFIVTTALGEGKIVYVGYPEDQSKFKYDIAYPIFWQQLIDYIIGKETRESLNFKVGDKLLFDSETKIKTPTKETKGTEVDFDEVGVYMIQNKKYALSLLNKIESQISFKEKELEFNKIDEEKDDEKEKKHISEYFIEAFLVLLFLELFYVKFRGDL